MLASIVVAAWIYLAVAHGRFWQAGPELPSHVTPSQMARVAVVIPARDEAPHIEHTLYALLRQDYPWPLRIILVDDNSTDGTGEIARDLAAEDPRLTVLQGQPLPSGWTGKMWAVSQGLKYAEDADYVLLTDADIVHAQSHVAQLVAAAQAGGYDLVSEMVRLRCRTLPERFGIPAFVFFFAMLYPFARVADPRSKVAAAAGGTMLLSQAALRRIEGVSRIRAELIDDCALAREVKRGGHATWLGHATCATSLREYPKFADIWQMIARTAYVQLHYSPLLLLGTVAGMLLLYAAPIALALHTHGVTMWCGAAAWVLMAALFQPILRRYQQSPLWGIVLPLIAMFYMAATVASAVRFYRGKGGQWKDRTYPVT
ncbi:glycosyltransferase [Terriglobus sp. RCC_193]|uniref:glycosyltransferase n=1 Tax=Terriglobus sp. RCC_193 TaxID=3239218 RepID=UPI003526C0B8